MSINSLFVESSNTYTLHEILDELERGPRELSRVQKLLVLGVAGSEDQRANQGASFLDLAHCVASLRANLASQNRGRFSRPTEKPDVALPRQRTSDGAHIRTATLRLRQPGANFLVPVDLIVSPPDKLCWPPSQ